MSTKISKRPRKPVSKSTSNTATGRVFLFLIVVLLVGYAAWFLSTHKLVDTGARYTPIDEVAKNPYFAASLMLEQAGKSATFVPHAEADMRLQALWQDSKNASHHSVVLGQINDAQKSSFDAMLAWVQAGGQLIVFNQTAPYYQKSDNQNQEESAPDDYAWHTIDDWQSYEKNENPLLIHLGIYNIYKERDDKPSEEAQKSDEWYPDSSIKPFKLDDTIVVLRESSFGGFDASEFVKNYDATLNDYRALYKGMSDSTFEANFASLSAQQRQTLKKVFDSAPDDFLTETVMIDAKLGKGRLVVLDMDYAFTNPYAQQHIYKDDNEAKKSRLATLLAGEIDGEMTYNYGISENDHAYLLNYLTDGRKEILFVPAFEQTSLWLLIKKHLPFMLFALIAMAVLSLLALPRQFGRYERLSDDSGTNILGYYRAVGQYLWQSDACLAQVESNRERLYEKVRAVLPVLHNKDRLGDKDAICHLIAKDARLEPELVFLALYGNWQHEREFVEMSRAFARLAQHYAD